MGRAADGLVLEPLWGAGFKRRGAASREASLSHQFLASSFTLQSVSSHKSRTERCLVFSHSQSRFSSMPPCARPPPQHLASVTPSVPQLPLYRILSQTRKLSNGRVDQLPKFTQLAQQSGSTLHTLGCYAGGSPGAQSWGVSPPGCAVRKWTRWNSQGLRGGSEAWSLQTFKVSTSHPSVSRLTGTGPPALGTRRILAPLFSRKILFSDSTQRAHRCLLPSEVWLLPKAWWPTARGWLSGRKTQKMWSEGEQGFPSLSGISRHRYRRHSLSALRNPYFPVAQRNSLWGEDITTDTTESV